MISSVRGTIPGRGETRIAVIDGDTHISHWVETEGRLDHDQNMLPKILAMLTPGAVVVDAGAFIGDHTAAYAHAVGPSGFVYAFEPNPEAAECCRRNCDGLPVTVIEAGLASSPMHGSVVANPNAGASYLTPAREDGPCRLTRLDHFFMGRPRMPNLIKMDIEGWELDALVGAKGIVDTFRPVLVLEVNAAALARRGAKLWDLYNYLLYAGYYTCDIYTGEQFSPHDDRPQFDVVAIPDPKPGARVENAVRV